MPTQTRQLVRRGGAWLVAAILTLTGLVALGSSSESTVIVQGSDLNAVSRAVTSAGGEVTETLPIIGGVTATVPPDGVDELAGTPGLTVTDDASVEFQASEFSDEASTTSADTVEAEALHAAGIDGSGVGIAVVDTGIDASHPGLGDRVVSKVDLTEDATLTDGFGHGTFMAGLAAAGGDDVVGTAPGAHLVDVKVADAEGNTTLSEVLSGLQFVSATKDQFDIGVVSLALAVEGSADLDPLEAAVEQLWAEGVVVVAAVGNDGGEPSSPASSPYVVAVGAYDDQGTGERADDVEVDWSASGAGDLGVERPDVLAPGKSVVSLRVPGSTIDEEHPSAREGEGYFRGTGTSMAAATTAGAAALLLDANPGLTPDEVKGRLVASSADRHVDVAAAAEVEATANGDLPPLTARSSTLPEGDGEWTADSDIYARSWTGRSWTGRSWTGRSWTGRSWTGRSWTGRSWTARSWAAQSWA